MGNDGFVWGGVNAGGSLTTMPLYSGSTAAAVATLSGVAGSWNRFLLPEFASATCRFNITLGATVRGAGARGGRQGRCTPPPRGLCALLVALAAGLDTAPLPSACPPPLPQFPGGVVTITPMLNWGFGGM